MHGAIETSMSNEIKKFCNKGHSSLGINDIFVFTKDLLAKLFRLCQSDILQSKYLKYTGNGRTFDRQENFIKSSVLFRTIQFHTCRLMKTQPAVYKSTHTLANFLKKYPAQVNHGQKPLFLHQLAHNWWLIVHEQYMKIPSWEHVYRNCFRHSEQFLYTTCSAKRRASDKDLTAQNTVFKANGLQQTSGTFTRFNDKKVNLFFSLVCKKNRPTKVWPLH